MYGSLALAQKTLRDYVDIAGLSAIEELEELARPLRGLRVLNLSVTAFGSRMGNALQSSVPLFADLGLECTWQVARPSEEFSQVVQAMYLALAGGTSTWNSDLGHVWDQYESMNAGLLTRDFDVIIVHDPQLTAVRSFVEDSPGGKSAKWVFDCHMDLNSAAEDVWQLLHSHIDRYDQVLFESPGAARHDMRAPVRIMTPAIDPLDPRNMDMPEDTIRTICERYGIDRDRPTIAHVSPFDEGHNPIAAIEVFDNVQREIPELQLLMIATLVPQDQAARSYFDQVATSAADRPGVHVLSELNYVGHVELNVCQRASDIALQAALHRGYGIHLAESLWKERPAIGPSSGGIPELVLDGKTGFLANSIEEATDRALTIFREPDLATDLGKAAKEYVRGHFLITRYLRDYLRMFQELLHGA